MSQLPDEQGFTIPQAFLTQLQEYTQGFILVACNEAGGLSLYRAFDNAVIKMGLINFADIQVSAMQEYMHNSSLEGEKERAFERIDNVELGEDTGEDEDDDEDENHQIH